MFSGRRKVNVYNKNQVPLDEMVDLGSYGENRRELMIIFCSMLNFGSEHAEDVLLYQMHLSLHLM